MMRLKTLACFLLFSIPTLNSSAEEARGLLQTTLAKYRNLSTYYVEGTRESVTTDEIQRYWQQERFALGKAPGNRYHYDIQGQEQWNIVVANGAEEWTFQPWRNEYTRRPVPPELTAKASGPDDEIRAFIARLAQNYVEDLSQGTIRTAEFLPEENITLAGQRISCYVVRATYERAEDAVALKHPAQITFWIEKDRKLVRKETVSIRDSASILQPLHEIDHLETTYYTTVDLQGPPPEELFSFGHTKGARVVRRLFLSDRAIDLSGFPAPPLNLKTLDGKPFDWTSVKGHPVLVDFWASWCVPCIQQMRSLSKLADEPTKQGLIFIGINWGDDDPKTALEFLKENHYDWINLRADTETASAWMLNGVPLVAVIDPEGNIAYYHPGYEEPEERAIVNALRKINPIFSIATAQCQGSTETP